MCVIHKFLFKREYYALKFYLNEDIMEKMKYPREWRGEKGMEITHRVVDYIQKHHLSAEEIAAKTGVAGEILSGKTQRGLNASEFLTICSYLKVDPYDFYDRSSEEWRRGC